MKLPRKIAEQTEWNVKEPGHVKQLHKCRLCERVARRSAAWRALGLSSSYLELGLPPAPAYWSPADRQPRHPPGCCHTAPAPDRGYVSRDRPFVHLMTLINFQASSTAKWVPCHHGVEETASRHGGYLRIYWINSRGPPTRGDSPALKICGE
jgi:hypothetical protein